MCLVHCQAAGKGRAACSPSSLLRWQMLRKSRTERWIQEDSENDAETMGVGASQDGNVVQKSMLANG